MAHFIHDQHINEGNFIYLRMIFFNIFLGWKKTGLRYCQLVHFQNNVQKNKFSVTGIVYVFIF
jgi:hypothetical protein